MSGRRKRSHLVSSVTSPPPERESSPRIQAKSSLGTEFQTRLRGSFTGFPLRSCSCPDTVTVSTGPPPSARITIRLSSTVTAASAGKTSTIDSEPEILSEYSITTREGTVPWNPGSGDTDTTSGGSRSSGPPEGATTFAQAASRSSPKTE